MGFAVCVVPTVVVQTPFSFADTLVEEKSSDSRQFFVFLMWWWFAWYAIHGDGLVCSLSKGCAMWRWRKCESTAYLVSAKNGGAEIGTKMMYDMIVFRALA